MSGNNTGTTAYMAELIEAQARGEGFSPSRIDGVQFVRSTVPIPRSPTLYNPSIVIVAQGQKKGYLGGNVYTYDSEHYLVMSVPLPFECETTIACPEKPLLAVSISVESTMLSELMLEMDTLLSTQDTPRGVYSSRITLEIQEATCRLLGCLQTQLESQILARQTIREIVFRVLCGEQGWALRALAGLNVNFIQVSRALKLIHAQYHQELSVERLASATNMSASNFHQVFKAVTATTPIQYIKSLRLHKARTLMVQGGVTASAVAASVGYASSSQFNREFKRFFGRTPLEEASQMRGFGFARFEDTDVLQ